ncbi:MAG: hypothetical protein HYT93_04860 [Parcubacteria group bacterium]|nr:hypothetical protein [Parcubacteria group bacterium]
MEDKHLEDRNVIAFVPRSKKMNMLGTFEKGALKTETYVYTLVMLQKTKIVLENWLVGCIEGDAVSLTLRNEKNTIVQGVFPGPIAESLFSGLLGSKISYTTETKVSGKQVGDMVPNVSGMVWFKEELHKIKVLDGVCADAIFIGTKNTLSSKPL